MNQYIYCLTEKSIDHIRLKPFATAVTIFSVTLCLVLAGAGAMLHRSVKRSMSPWMSGKEALAFLHSDVTAQSLARIAQEIRQWPEIADVHVAPRYVLLKYVLGEIDGNRSPTSLQIELRAGYEHVEDGGKIIERIRQLPEIEQVYHGSVWPEKVQSLWSFLRFAEIGAAVVVVVLMITIIFGAVRHTVLVRQEESEIYRIVGATPLFIRAPFYVEGMLHGVASALAASALLYLAAASLPNTLPLPAPLSWPASDWLLLATGLFASGAASGCLGAWLALR